MLEKFIYENHLGERFVGLENGVYLNYNDLRDYSWNYDTINSKISRFYKQITDKNLPLVACGVTEEKAISAKNRLLDIAEADIVAKIPGRIFVGDYYMIGYVTKSTKSNYLITKRLTNINLTFTSDDPVWCREKSYSFATTETANADEMQTIGGTDYNVAYDYDFAAALPSQDITVDSTDGATFKIRVYGKAEYPLIAIGGHSYSVNGVVEDGESLLIDALNKKITLTTESGNAVNWFDRRNRESDIFQPIPSGTVSVAWTGNFAFDLTVIEKRSEPRWI